MISRFLRGNLRTRYAWCLLLVVAVCNAVVVEASELRSTKSFADIAAAVEKAVAKYGAEHVLLALDIDNTIMSMDNDLGSDHWFEWQRYLLENEPESPSLVASTFEGLLEVQGALYERGQMHPPEANQPETIARLQKLGIATILLTSRGPEFRAVTERELKRCGYDFVPTALSVPKAETETFLPYNPADPERNGLTKTDLEVYKLGDPRPVSYTEGLFMTAGQHKGIMLLTLLKDSPRQIRAVVYADDNLRHIGSVFSAADARGIDIGSYQYQAEDIRVQRFNYGSKKDVDQRWRAIVAESAPAARSTEVAVIEKPVQKNPPRKVIIRRRCCIVCPCCSR